MKSEIDVRAKKLIELNKKSGQTSKTEEIKKIYSSFTKTISRLQSKAIGDFKRFSENVENKNDLKCLSMEELLAKSIASACLFISYDDLAKEIRKDELVIGLIVECNWYLTNLQASFIKNKL